MERHRMRLLKESQYTWGDVPNAIIPPAHARANTQSAQKAPAPSRSNDASWCDQPLDFKGQTLKRMERGAAPVASSQPAITSKGWTLEGLLQSGKRFEAVPRITALSPPHILEKAIGDHEIDGKPLIISDWEKHPSWPKDMFSMQWLLDHGDQEVQARNCVNWVDKKMTMTEFIKKSRESSHFIEPQDTERFYGKDATCPKEWEKWIEGSALPDQLIPNGSNNLLQYLPETERVETLMCYFGIGDTFTPAHKDLCASSGQNLMCFTEDDGSSFWFMTESSAAPAAAEYFQKLGHELDHETKVITVKELAEAPFKVYIAEQKLGDLVLVPKRSCHQVVNYGGLTIKASWSRMTVNGLVTAYHHELPIYRRVCRPETYRVKTLCYRTLLHHMSEIQQAWDKPEASKDEPSAPLPSSPALPSTSSVLSSDLHYDALQISSDKRQAETALSPEKQKLAKSKIVADLREMVDLFDKILKEEHQGAFTAFSYMQTQQDNGTSESPTTASQASEHATLCCDFCGADIFQSFFECKRCGSYELPPSSSSTDTAPALTVTSDQASTVLTAETLIICPGCSVEGRSCACKSMEPMQIRPFDRLFEDRNKATQLLNKMSSKWDMKKPDMSIPILRVVEQLPVFEGACRLWSARNDCARSVVLGKHPRTDRQCIVSGSHAVPQLASLYCKKCHCTKCFVHMLQAGVHASEALVESNRDVEHAKWHEFHMKHRGLFAEKRLEGMEAEKSGRSIHARIPVVLAAIKYIICCPLSPKTSIGWYDDKYYLEWAFESIDSFAEETTPPAAGPAENIRPLSIERTRDGPAIAIVEQVSPVNVSPSEAHRPKVPKRRRTADTVLTSTASPNKHGQSASSTDKRSKTEPINAKRQRIVYAEMPSFATLGVLPSDYRNISEFGTSKVFRKRNRPGTRKASRNTVVLDSDSGESTSSDESPPTKKVARTSASRAPGVQTRTGSANVTNNPISSRPLAESYSALDDTGPTTARPGNLLGPSQPARKEYFKHRKPLRSMFKPANLPSQQKKRRKEPVPIPRHSKRMMSRPSSPESSLTPGQEGAAHPFSERVAAPSLQSRKQRPNIFIPKASQKASLSETRTVPEPSQTDEIEMADNSVFASDLAAVVAASGSVTATEDEVVHSPMPRLRPRMEPLPVETSRSISTSTFPISAHGQSSGCSEPEPSTSQQTESVPTLQNDVKAMLIPLIETIIQGVNSQIRQSADGQKAERSEPVADSSRSREAQTGYENALQTQLQAKRIETLEHQLEDVVSRTRRMENVLNNQDQQFQTLLTMVRGAPAQAQAPIVLQLRGSIDNSPLADTNDFHSWHNYNYGSGPNSNRGIGRGRGGNFVYRNQAPYGRPYQVNTVNRPNSYGNHGYRRWDQGPTTETQSYGNRNNGPQTHIFTPNSKWQGQQNDGWRQRESPRQENRREWSGNPSTSSAVVQARPVSKETTTTLQVLEQPPTPPRLEKPRESPPNSPTGSAAIISVEMEEDDDYLNGYDERTPPPTRKEPPVHGTKSNAEVESETVDNAQAGEIDEGRLYAVQTATKDEAYYNENPWASECRGPL